MDASQSPAETSTGFCLEMDNRSDEERARDKRSATRWSLGMEGPPAPMDTDYHKEMESATPRVRVNLTFIRLWKNLKLHLKRNNAEARRERFTTGGGPPRKDKTDELGDLLSGIIEDQQPLDGVPDDDHLDSGHELSSNEETNLIMLEEPMHSQCEPSTSAMASQRKDDATTSQQRPKRMPMHEKLAREFHEHIMKYLNEEHDMKMRILQLELDMKLEERAAPRKRK